MYINPLRFRNKVDSHFVILRRNFSSSFTIRVVDLIGNYVNLQDGIGKDRTDQYIAIRCREEVQMGDTTIAQIDENNICLQECIKQNHFTTRDGFRGLVPGHRRILQNNEDDGDDLEWNSGNAPGCPFMNRM